MLAARIVRKGLVLIAAWAVFSSSAEAAAVATKNFTVHARNSDVARQVAEYAEQYRREKALDWLGFELPPWPTPCTVHVKVTFGGAGGATSFNFEQGVVKEQEMHVEGPLDRILDSVLPHEVTHTIFAAKFRRPLPRWADEGGSVLSEDYSEMRRHDLLCREVINQQRMIPLRRLFVLTEYPRDVMALYAQGFSVANYLVGLNGRQHFLNFVAEGQMRDWDSAAQRFYGCRSVDEMQDRWIEWIRAGRGTGYDPPALLASKTPAIKQASQIAARAPQPVIRAQMPDEGDAVAASRPVARQAPASPRPEAVRNGGPPVRTAAAAPPARNSAAPPPKVAEDSDDSGRQLIPIAVGRARRSFGSSDAN